MEIETHILPKNGIKVTLLITEKPAKVVRPKAKDYTKVEGGIGINVQLPNDIYTALGVAETRKDADAVLEALKRLL